jgi:hypothetical protein
MAVMMLLGGVRDRKGVHGRGVCRMLLVLLIILHALARTAMIVEVFIDLRSLPAGAFETVQWLKFIPHL